MTRLTIATAALAAGLTAFAPQAWSERMDIGGATAKAVLFNGKSQGEGVDDIKTGSVTSGAKDAAKSAGKGSSYDAIIAKYATIHGVPVALAKAVVRVESNFRPDARGRAGEIGLMQIKPATARMMGYSGSAKGLYDPNVNIQYGMKYLAGAHKLGGGDVCGTILRYNAGHGAKRMNPISAAYCAKVKRQLSES